MLKLRKRIRSYLSKGRRDGMVIKRIDVIKSVIKDLNFFPGSVLNLREDLVFYVIVL